MRDRRRLRLLAAPGVGLAVMGSLVLLASPASAGPGSLSGPAGLSVEAAYAAMSAETTVAAATAAGTSATGAAGAAALTTAEAAAGIGWASALGTTVTGAVVSVAGWIGGKWLVDAVGGLLGGPSVPPGWVINNPSPYFTPRLDGQIGTFGTTGLVSVRFLAAPNMGWYTAQWSAGCANGSGTSGGAFQQEFSEGGGRLIQFGLPAGRCTSTGGVSWVKVHIQDYTGRQVGWVAGDPTWPNDDGAWDATFYLPGTGTQAPPAADPMAGAITQKLTCTNGVATATVSQSTPVILQAGTEYDVPNLMCPEGFVVKDAGADWTPSTPGAGTQTVIPTTPTDPGTQAIPTEYPLCLVQTCTLELFRIQPAPLQSCGAYAIGCPEWWDLPAATRDDYYECHFGPYVIALDRCSVYRVPGVVTPNTDTTTAGPSYNPAPTLPAPPVAPDPGTDPAAARRCWPTGWSMFNPLEWVYRPITCAFVPSRGPATLTRMQTALDESPPVVWVAAFSEPFEGWGITGAGCRGPGFQLWGVDVYVFSACDAPMSNIAGVTKAFATVAVSIYGGYACLRGILYGFSIQMPRLGGGSGGD